MIDIALDKTTHDLYFSNADLAVVRDLDSVEQSLKARLLTYLGEWFLDTTAGLPFYTSILIKNPNIPNIENLIKSVIIDTMEVIEIMEFDSEFENSTREYTVTFKARTTFGVTDLSVSLFDN